MKTMAWFEMGMTCRAGALTSLWVLASAGNSFGQEPLNLKNLEFVCLSAEACTITFEIDPGLQIIVLTSPDLDCWVFSGACNEIDLSGYQYVDFGAVDLPQQFYRFGEFSRHSSSDLD